MSEPLLIGEYLVRKELISPRAIAQVVKEQPVKRQRLISMLILRAELEIDDAATVLSEQSGYPAAFERHLERRDMGVAKLLPAALCAQHGVMPIGKTAGGRLVVGARDPSPALQAALERATQLSIELAIVPSILIERLVKATFNLVIEPAPEFPAGRGSIVRARSVSGLYADTQPPKPASVPQTAAPEAGPLPSPRQGTPKVVIPERKSDAIRAITDYDAPILLDRPKRPSGMQAVPKPASGPQVAIVPPASDADLSKSGPTARAAEPVEKTQPRLPTVGTPRISSPAEREAPPPEKTLLGLPTVGIPAATPPPSSPPASAKHRVGTQPVMPIERSPGPVAGRPPLRPAPPERSGTHPPPLQDGDGLDAPTVRPTGTSTRASEVEPRAATTPALARTKTEPSDPALIARLRPPQAPAIEPDNEAALEDPVDEVTRPTVAIDPPPAVARTRSRNHAQTTPAPSGPLPEDARPPDRRQHTTRPAPNAPIPAEARQPRAMSEAPYESVAVSGPGYDPRAGTADPVPPVPSGPPQERAPRARSVSEMFDDLLDEPQAAPTASLPAPPSRPSPPSLPPAPRSSAPVLPPPPVRSVRAATEPTLTAAPPRPPAPPGTGSIEAVGKEIERAISRATADRVLIAFAGSRFKAALLVMVADGVARGARGHGPRLQAVQTVVLPIEAPSIIQIAHDTRALTREAPSSPTQDRLAELLGSSAPLAVPILVDDTVVAVLVVGDPVEPGASDDDLQRVAAAFATAYKRLHKSK